VDVNIAKSKRYGNVLLDLTGFVRKSHDTGWQFKGLLLIRACSRCAELLVEVTWLSLAFFRGTNGVDPIG
jgi:hypothetical protein